MFPAMPVMAHAAMVWVLAILEGVGRELLCAVFLTDFRVMGGFAAHFFRSLLWESTLLQLPC
jgi:hypothetical protein